MCKQLSYKQYKEDLYMIDFIDEGNGVACVTCKSLDKLEGDEYFSYVTEDKVYVCRWDGEVWK